MTGDLPPDMSELLAEASKEFHKFVDSPAAVAAVDQSSAQANDLIRTGIAMFMEMDLAHHEGNETKAFLAGMCLRTWVETLSESDRNLLVRVLLEMAYNRYMKDTGYPGDPAGYLAAHGENGECLHGHAHDQS